MKFEQMSKKRKAYTVVLFALVIATLGFIWGHSLVPETDSAAESGRIYSLLEPVFKAIFGEGAITEALLRKFAHITEFFVLGLEFSLILLSFKRYSIKTFFVSVALGLSVGFIDETLQAIVGRGALITDVWIDGGGFLGSSLIFLATYYIIYAIKNRKNKKDGKSDE